MMKNNTSTHATSRRQFLQTSAAASAGLVIGFHWPCANAQVLAPANMSGATEINAWIHITPDNRTILKFARSEMGQGASTALPQLLAEELECDWSRVELSEAMFSEHLARNRVYVSTSTGGSRGVRDSQAYLLKAGATARVMLVQAAAEKWGVPANECNAANSVITHAASKRTMTYGEIASAAAKLKAPESVALKDVKDWKILGKSVPRFDIPDKVIGKPMYGIDVVRPGMVHAAIAQCPVFGGKTKSIDAASLAAAKKMRGIDEVLDMGSYVAVTGNNWWRCNQAVKSLKIEWDVGENGNVSSASIKTYLSEGLANPGAVGKNVGDFAATYAAAPVKLEAEYYAPYLDHTPMEPMNCTAEVKDGRVTVWVPTQSAEGSAAAAAGAAGVAPEKVEVFRQQLGGGFGRRGGFQDFTRQAVEIAKKTGKTVKLLWSREEDVQHGHYRPVTLAKVQGALDKDGKLVALSGRVAVQSILERVRPEALRQTPDGPLDPQGTTSFEDTVYDIPNLRAEHVYRKTHVPVGFWRSVSHSQNPMFRECFLDELLAKSPANNRDPYQFRRAMLQGSSDAARRDLGVLDAVAKAADWTKPLPANVYRGIAVQDAYGSHAASVVEIEKRSDGKLKIKRVVIVVDPGHVANEGAARAQIEGCVIYGLTAVLYGEITIKHGRVEQSNFNDYPMMKINETPEVVSILAPTGGFWGGMGEPPMAPLVPAFLNAIFAATGKPIRSLPLKHSGLTFA
jgi:isoquinoline 1-oxidoreductase subunit beta